MSNDKKKISQNQDGSSKDHFVLDFLYHDGRRIGSFLSQFEQFGLLSSVTQSKTANEAESQGYLSSVGGSAAGLIAGRMEENGNTSSGISDVAERIYDPFWSNARAFLDHLSEHRMIQNDVMKARMGQFVSVKGALVISDLKMLQNLWKSEQVKKFIKQQTDDAQHDEPAGNRQQRAAAKAISKKTKGQVSESDLVMELLPYLPHSSQFHVVNDDFAAWGPIQEEAIVGSAAELTLKHGAKIAGEWTMVGILDAMPFETDDLLSVRQMTAVGMLGENITKVPLTLAPFIWQLLGRPAASYGLTPLLVFREVAK